MVNGFIAKFKQINQITKEQCANAQIRTFAFLIFAPMTEKILILDFGSQYTQLIARAVREANVFCEIIPYLKSFEYEASLKGVILSGSPFSVNDQYAPLIDARAINQNLPILGICYGAQLIAKLFGGIVEKSDKENLAGPC